MSSLSRGERWGEVERGAFDAMMQSATNTLPHHVGLRKKALPGVAQTHGEWRGVKTLARVKSRGYVPPKRPIGTRKNSKAADRAIAELQG
jgi:hypothetical protein